MDYVLSNNRFLYANGFLSNNGCTSRVRSALRAGMALRAIQRSDFLIDGFLNHELWCMVLWLFPGGAAAPPDPTANRPGL